MKKLFLMCAVAAVLCGCGTKGEVREEKIEGVDLTFSRYELRDSCMSGVEGVDALCRIDFSLPYVVGKTDIANKINNAVLGCEFEMCNNSLEMEMRTYANYLMNSYQEDVESTTDGMTLAEIENEPWNSFNYAYVRKGEFVKGGGNVLCYLSSDYVYTGGAHGISGSNAMNFDVRNGDLLLPEDLFLQSMQESVRSAVQDQLIDDLGMDQVNTGTPELNAVGYTFKGLIPMTDVLLLGEDGVVFVYPVYSIASYAQGEQRVTLRYDQLMFAFTDRAKEVLAL